MLFRLHRFASCVFSDVFRVLWCCLCAVWCADCDLACCFLCLSDLIFTIWLYADVLRAAVRVGLAQVRAARVFSDVFWSCLVLFGYSDLVLLRISA